MLIVSQHAARSRRHELLLLAQSVGRTMRLPLNLVLALGFLCGHGSNAVAADESEVSSSQPMPDEPFAIHGQTTYVEQETDSFRAPYSGANSLSPASSHETVDATLLIGARLCPGAEGGITPEMDRGFGLNNPLGVAGFPSGEAYKIGKNQPYMRLPRAFVRQT